MKPFFIKNLVSLLFINILLALTNQVNAQAIKEGDFLPRQLGIDDLKAKVLSGANQDNIYALGKAQCWLNFAKHEWYRNDASNVVKEALTEADLLITVLNQAKPVNTDTRLVDNAQRIRSDLWLRAQEMKKVPTFRCAAVATGCAEVLLVQAAHNQAQLGWRYANPYVGMAEDMMGYAEQEAKKCIVPAPVPATIVATPVAAPTTIVEPAKPVQLPPVALVAASQINIDASALFNFDKYRVEHMLPEGKVQIDAAVKKLSSFKKVLAIKLEGHTDRLGSVAYNDKLSQRRVDTIKQYMVSQGVSTDLITTVAKGKSEQIVDCNIKQLKTAAALKKCLQPNRRVVIRFIVEQ